jgi:hypothetical protein
VRPYLKNTQHTHMHTHTRAGRVAQVVERLLSKHEALNSHHLTSSIIRSLELGERRESAMRNYLNDVFEHKYVLWVTFADIWKKTKCSIYFWGKIFTKRRKRREKPRTTGCPSLYNLTRQLKVCWIAKLTILRVLESKTILSKETHEICT